jgi:hypothetical protein
VLLALALIVWAINPFACLLLVPAVHLWLLAVAPSTRHRLPALAALMLSVVPLALLLAFYAHELGLGPVALAQSAVLLLAGGQVGLAAIVLWSVAFGCLMAVVLLDRPEDLSDTSIPGDWAQISTRGPVSYAGPGSLGGTRSALRR